MFQTFWISFLLFIIYYSSKTFIVCHLIISFLATLILYSSITKNFFPRMKIEKGENWKTKVQYYHELYPFLERNDLHIVSFGKMFLGFSTYFWIKLVAACFSMYMMNIPFR